MSSRSIWNPFDRLVSNYYFLRYGDNFRKGLLRSKNGDTTTFNECAKKESSKDCSIQKMWIQIPYFCGQVAACWEPGSQWALDRAKQNVLEHYFLVGKTENLIEFVELLENEIPAVFKCVDSRQASWASKFLDAEVMHPDSYFQLSGRCFEWSLIEFLSHDFSVANYASKLKFAALAHYSNFFASFACWPREKSLEIARTISKREIAIVNSLPSKNSSTTTVDGPKTVFQEVRKEFCGRLDKIVEKYLNFLLLQTQTGRQQDGPSDGQKHRIRFSTLRTKRCNW
ncbi:Oidioi.mRNA.OKI2018_I69.chr1.g3927.t1.cds [Oikopleura dioica]|uniref:Oidioi.mRNA.OKI2018_I69.chr1.g3927.t1.cds n=1 Tax=Oikopleura dioica TaxID=34765 RepID=A0ABN7SVC3_OIKDI|nr:Oidioi.mRNA.OKI2018_I69.chr1.g3927.t1.cds [Oikopleura dioica]